VRFFDGAAVDGALGYPGLVDILQAAFEQGAIAPLRHHHAIELDGRPEATLLLMPAWEASAAGAATAGRYPDNAERGRPAVNGTYLLLSAESGETLAVMDATRLTAWRTAAASALASRYLSRPDATRLLMVGAGAMASQLILAHASVRSIREIALWNRSPERARALMARLCEQGLNVSLAADLEAAVRRADIVSVATISTDPLIQGAWLKAGSHVDGVGAFRANMRETDDALVRRARIYVDTRAGAYAEAGDIVKPLNAGVIGKEAIVGDLFDLARGTVGGRKTAEEITFFKSVGAAIEDLAAAIAVYQKA